MPLLGKTGKCDLSASKSFGLVFYEERLFRLDKHMGAISRLSTLWVYTYEGWKFIRNNNFFVVNKKTPHFHVGTGT